MGAEKGNYTVSDLCMTVGFGLGLKVGGRMIETSNRDVALAHERMSKRPPNGDPPVSQVRSRSESIATLCTCPTNKLPQCE